MVLIIIIIFEILLLPVHLHIKLFAIFVPFFRVTILTLKHKMMGMCEEKMLVIDEQIPCH